MNEKEKVLASFEQTNDMLQTIKETKIKRGKVRKILITERMWTSERTESVKEKMKPGKRPETIAKELDIDKYTVYNYLPYTRRMYDKSPETNDSIRSYNYRKRILNAEKNKKRRSREEKNKLEQTSFRVNVTNRHILNMQVASLSANNIPYNIKESIPIPVEELFKRYGLYEYVEAGTILNTLTHTFSKEYLEIPNGTENMPKTNIDSAEAADSFIDDGHIGRVYYKLHCSIDLNGVPIRILKDYGKAEEGISRDILIPGDTPLAVFHFMLQRLFGWQDFHLHSFHLGQRDFSTLTKNTLDGYLAHAGELFSIPAPGEIPYRDNRKYEPSQDIKHLVAVRRWLKGQYSTDSISSHRDEYRRVRIDAISKALEFYLAEVPILKNLEKPIPEADYMKYLPFHDELLEVATLDDIFRYVDHFLYLYDPYGDKWKVNISLLGSTHAMAYVSPFCEAADGLMVMEDIGGIRGYARFLERVKHSKMSELDWVKALRDGYDSLGSDGAKLLAAAADKGWTGRRPCAKNLL